MGYVFEIKRRFEADAVARVFRQVERVREGFPRYADSAIYPFIAAGVISGSDERRVWREGVHLLRFGDGAFRLCRPPAGFRPAHGRGMDGRHGRMLPAPYPQYLRRLAGGAPAAPVH